MADNDKISFQRSELPKDGVQITLPEGKVLTRIHLDMGKDGVTLASVGAASSTLKPGHRHQVTLKPAKEGVSLSIVGAASAVKSSGS